jgi:hypothetical protein
MGVSPAYFFFAAGFFFATFFAAGFFFTAFFFAAILTSLLGIGVGWTTKQCMQGLACPSRTILRHFLDGSGLQGGKTAIFSAYRDEISGLPG